jgi:transcriptional regulator with XRE-family HTH domain
MDTRKDIRDFLTSRRARITPERAGLPAYGGNRRVAGLRREEVALLAGVSVDYYTRLERGNLTGVSESVLHSVALALQLDDAEREHLFDLARVANATPRTRRRRTAAGVRPSAQRVLDAMSGAPAWVHNDRLDFRSGPAREQCQVHVSQSAIAGLLSGLGADRRQHRRDTARCGRA